MKRSASIYYSDPPFRFQGMEWVRGDLTPMLLLKYHNGQDYQFPYMLSPTEEAPPPPGGGTTTTFSIGASNDDQEIFLGPVGVYPPTGTPTRSTANTQLTAQRSTLGSYYVYNILLKFDTSPLDNATTITAATLRCYVLSKFSPNSLSLTAGWYAWDGTSTTDHTNTPETSALAGVTLASITTSSDNDFVLTDSAGFPGVSKTSYTYLRLHISQRAADAAPTGENSLTIASLENASLAEPRLIVTHT